MAVNFRKLLDSIDSTGSLSLQFKQSLQTSQSDQEVDASRQSATTVLRRVNQHIPLFDYQSEISEAIVENLRRDTSSSLIVSLPTGGGKTRTAMYAVLKALDSNVAERVIWLAPANELLDQAQTSAKNIWMQEPTFCDVALFRWGSGESELSEDVTKSIEFATPQLLIHRMRQSLTSKDYDVIVFDEAHHLLAPTFRSVIEGISSPTTTLLGLSATPGRSNAEATEELSELFDGKMLVSDRLKPNAVTVLRRRGILADLQFRTIKAEDDDLSKFQALIQLCKRIETNSDRALVFCESVSYGTALNIALHSLGVDSDIVTGSTPKPKRESTLRRFEYGQLRILINKQLLTTGYDAPGFQHLLLATRIGSPVLFEQIVGRAARGVAIGGVPIATVWQFEDHLALHGYPKSYYRYEDFEWSKISTERLHEEQSNKDHKSQIKQGSS